MAGQQAQFQILQVAHGATINCGGDTEPERGPGPVYDAVEVEEVHSGTTEEDLGTGDYNDDAMALTEIETDTGLELAYDGGAAKTPPAVSFQAGLSRRQRPQPVTEVEYVPQEAPQKSRRGQRRFRKNRLVNNGVREREEGKTDPPLRPFQMKWLLLYPWLRYEIATKFMHCAWCMESGKKNAFGKNGGTNNFRKSNCEEHQKSHDHKSASGDYGLKNPSYRRVQNGDALDPVMQNVTAVRGADGSVIYQGNGFLHTGPGGAPVRPPALEQNPDIQFHAKKAHMLLTGFVQTKHLPSTLCKDLLELMPFMFPDSKIAAEIKNLDLN